MAAEIKGISNCCKVFSDESGCFNKNYQTIAAISGRDEDLSRLKIELNQILYENAVSEIKFEKIRTHRPKLKAASEFIEIAFKYVDAHAIKIDVLCWSVLDTRHNIENRDDQANLGRMYYKILRNISEKWEIRDWQLFPDKGSKLDWQEVIRYLNQTNIKRKPYILTLFEQNRSQLSFQRVAPQDSIDEPRVQLADLFAGMVRYSVEKKELCKIWLDEKNKKDQLGLFSEERVVTITKPDSNRFELINQVYNKAKKRALGVSLCRYGFLKSFKKFAALNFWHYVPASDHDKAPTRKG